MLFHLYARHIVRADLQRIIYQEWTKVSIMPPFYVGERGETVSL